MLVTNEGGAWSLAKGPRSDLAILLEPSHLEPVLCHLRLGIATAFQTPTKAHKATK